MRTRRSSLAGHFLGDMTARNLGTRKTLGQHGMRLRMHASSSGNGMHSNATLAVHTCSIPPAHPTVCTPRRTPNPGHTGPTGHAEVRHQVTWSGPAWVDGFMGTVACRGTPGITLTGVAGGSSVPPSFHPQARHRQPTGKPPCPFSTARRGHATRAKGCAGVPFLLTFSPVPMAIDSPASSSSSK